MARNKYFHPYKLKTPQDVKDGVNNIVEQLRDNGRAISVNPRASRVFANSMRENREKGDIVIGWDQDRSRKMIMLPPGYSLVQNKHKRIKIIYANKKGRL